MSQHGRRCEFCAKGFPLLGGIHYGTQALGMIRAAPCDGWRCSRCDETRVPDRRVEIAVLARGEVKRSAQICAFCASTILGALERQNPLTPVVMQKSGPVPPLARRYVCYAGPCSCDRVFSSEADFDRHLAAPAPVTRARSRKKKVR